MSFLAQAGQSSIKQINRAFTKGLYGVDPVQLQRKQMQRRMYQEQLKQQAQDAQRRKAAEKQRDREEDEKLQRKIQLDMMKEKEEKEKATKASKQVNTNNNTNNNETNPALNNRPQQFQLPGQKKNYTLAQSKSAATSLSSPQINLYKNLINNITQNNYPYESIQPPQHYQQNEPSFQRNYYNMEEEKYLQQEMENRARRFKETLDRKLQEVYRQLESSKKTQVGDNVVDQIRRRLRSNSYVSSSHGGGFEDGQKSMVKPFEEEFSQFYRIPKRNNQFNQTKSRTPTKNLDYNAESRYKSGIKNYINQDTRHKNYIKEENRQRQRQRQRNYQNSSRINTQRNDRTEYTNQENKWGNNRNDNFLGNRQAVDYKIQSTLNNIDAMIDSRSRQDEE